jgi:hypothetical protein
MFYNVRFAAVFLLVIVKTIAPYLELSRHLIRLTALDNLVNSSIPLSTLLKIKSYCLALSLLK